MDYNIVSYKKKKYVVMCITHKDIKYPLVINETDIDTIERLELEWKYNKHGFAVCSIPYKNGIKDIYMHMVIMILKLQDVNQETSDKHIIHINNIGLDNRRENILYDEQNKDINKNIIKKKRTIILPENSNIDPDDIPTYVWYMKPNKSHGERFMVSVGSYKWKTTSSKKFSLVYKLEEAKLYLRELKKKKPELFSEYSMNGDYTNLGKQLSESYYDIVHLAGYKNIKRYIHTNNTKKYLKVGTPTNKELLILRAQRNIILEKGRNRRLLTNLPENCGINTLPKYCYYRPPYNGRGSHFIVKNHPKQEKKTWQTTSSKKIDIKEKYKQLMDHIDDITLGL